MTWIVNWQTPDALTDGIIDVLAGESLEFSFDAIDPSINLSLNWGDFTAHLPWRQSYDLATVRSGTYELDGVSAWINATENNEFQKENFRLKISNSFSLIYFSKLLINILYINFLLFHIAKSTWNLSSLDLGKI